MLRITLIGLVLALACLFWPWEVGAQGGPLKLLGQYGFGVCGAEYGSYLKAWKEDLASPSRTARAKAVLGVSEYLASVLAIPASSRGDHSRQAQHEAVFAHAGGHVEAGRH